MSGECEVAESSTSAKESGAQKVPAKPSRPDTLKKAKKPRVLKTVTIAQRVEKYGKYGLYDNNVKLYYIYYKPCGKKMDETREDSLTRQKVHSLPVHIKKKAPQTETVGPSSPPPDTSKTPYLTVGRFCHFSG